MCKAFFVHHTCNHASAPRVKKSPLKIWIGECRGVKRIELKSPRLCSTCTTGLLSEHQQHLPAPRTTPNLVPMKPQPIVGKKTKKTYDWMNAAWKPGQKASSVDSQAQASPKRKTASQPRKTMPIVTDDQPLTKADKKKAKQLEARARNAAKKRDFQDALDESTRKAAIKKWKSDFKSKTTPCNLSCVEVQSPIASPSLPPIRTQPPLVKKPRKKAPPKNLDLQNSNAGPPHRKPTNFLSNPTTNSELTMIPESKTISSLPKLSAALASKHCSLGRSPTILRSALFSPSEIDRPVGLIYGEPLRPRRSPRLSPGAQAKAFLEKLGRQLVRGDETVWTLTSPKDVTRRATGAESPDQGELHEFERVMMESPSPITVEDKRAPAPAIHNGRGNGLAESSESEEE